MADASFNVPFLPQENITNSILSAIQLANQHSADQQAAQAKQRSLDIAQQEADTASKNLAQQAPEIQARTGLYNAQTADAQTASQLQAQKLVHDQIARDYLSGNGGSATQQQLSSIVGDHHAPGVPIEAPQTLDVENPIGQTLSAPTPPVSTDASVTPTSTTPSGPSPVIAQPKGIYADLAEINRRIGGFTEPEKDQLGYLLQVANANPNPSEAVQGLQAGVHALVQKRSDPTYATEVSLLKQGYSEPAAFTLAKRNADFAAELSKVETQPETLAGDKAAVSRAQLTAASQNPDFTQENRQRALRLAGVASVAEQNQLNLDAAKKKAEQAAKDGDPIAAAKLLTSGFVAPSQLISARNPDFAQKAFSAAQQMDPTFNLQKAEADYKAASSPANLNFFGPAHSMVDAGGTLDQLNAAAKAIPDGQIPIFNKLADAQKAALGSGPIAKYAAIALGVADDYSKITGGGGSDSAREQALHLLPADASPEARAASIDGIRGTVNSQINSRIGNNRVLKAQYGIEGAPTSSGPVAGGPPAGATHTGVSSVDGKTYYLDANNNKLGVAQ